MIDYEILQDIITDHELCKTQENELANVIELLKSDRLIELPCKVGDTVYTFKTYLDCDLNYECDQWQQHKCEDNKYCKHEYAIKRVGEAKFNIAMLTTLGKTVFLTKEEAEKALAELKGTEE